MKGQTVRLAGDQQRALAHRLIERAPPNAVVNIQEEARSADQNALMWVLLSDLSRAKPDGRRATPEVWKQLCMHACGHAVQFEMGIDGQPFPVGFRSSRLRKSEMADLITFIMAFGDSKGVQWSELVERKAA